jgi:glycosyltransferase involved in cell wall biosynthesis|tara:strand:+ start:1433 stop:2815 length:1383 start_codon:yes stop_codon:yes gene_type:complete
MKPSVTIYIPNYNYGQYLTKAIESVIDQNYVGWELLIILDDPIDDSPSIAYKYQSKSPEKIKVFSNDQRLGLQSCANIALDKSTGKYIMRLDPDDYLNESALTVLVHYLESNSDVALVYPDYFYVDKAGSILDIDTRKKIGRDVNLLDLPAHGACTLFRKDVIKDLGGYNESFDAQDGYDLWLNVLGKHNVANVSTPLFYYRQHSESLSKNQERILEARRKIKRHHVAKKVEEFSITAIIGAKNTYRELPNLVLSNVGGKPLIDYTLDIIDELDVIDNTLVTTDDEKVKDYCDGIDNLNVIVRDNRFSGEKIMVEMILNDAVNYLEKETDYHPDIVVFLNVNALLKQSKHVLKAIDTLLLFKTDSVMSVHEDFNLHFQHMKNGLEAVSKRRHKELRIEREALYVDNRAINVCWREVIKEDDMRGKKVGHILMSREDSYRIRQPFDVMLLDAIISHKNRSS